MQLRPPPNALPELIAERDDPILNYFGIAVRSERQRAGMSSHDLAVKLGQNRSTVVMWETGRGIPRFTNLLRLIAIFPGLIDALADLAQQLRELDDAASS